MNRILLSVLFISLTQTAFADEATSTNAPADKASPELEKSPESISIDQLKKLEAALTTKDELTRNEQAALNNAFEQIRLSNRLTHTTLILEDKQEVIPATKSIIGTRLLMQNSAVRLVHKVFKEKAPAVLIYFSILQTRLAAESAKSKSSESAIVSDFRKETGVAANELLALLPMTYDDLMDPTLESLSKLKIEAQKVGLKDFVEFADEGIKNLKEIQEAQKNAPNDDDQDSNIQGSGQDQNILQKQSPVRRLGSHSI